MSHRSVIQTLDLHDDYGKYHTEACPSQNYGWLSPRISFSTDFISATADKVSPEKQNAEEGHTYSSDFEFSMSSFNIFDTVSQGYIVPADELFHQGKLLPGYIAPCATSKDAPPIETLHLERSAGRPVAIAPHLSATENSSATSPLGCVLGPSCVRAAKGPKWRELFGALRRVKSDSGRQRIPDESLLPPKTMQGRKKFFKQLFSMGHGENDVKLGTFMNRPSSCATSSGASASENKNLASDTFSSPRASSQGLADFKDKARVLNPPQPCGTEATGRRAELRPDARGKSSGEGFSFNPLPGRGVSRTTGGSGVGRSSPARVPVRKMDRPPGASLSRSGSGRVIVRGLDRGCGSGRNYSFQEQARALRSREIRRSPDRSAYSASVRVTPVLNVPVCMGPVLRGATKAGKGKLSNFRSLLTFKSNKLPTSLSTPIATR